MILDSLQPFTQAVAAHGGKKILPTSLSSAQMRQELDATVFRTSMISAKTLITDLLEGYKTRIASIINPTTEQRPDRVTADNPEGYVTTGLNLATARTETKQALQELGYTPQPGEAGTLKDLSSDSRINLVLKTNTETAQGAGRFLQMNDVDVIDQFPAQELYRLIDTHKHRDWATRWQAAADESGDDDAARVFNETGRMIALKASPIWDSLGNGAGGYDDTLNNPYPPFAFNSGMWVKSVSRKEAESLGLMDAGDKVVPHPLSIENLFGGLTEALAG
jgi:hypothetical protein